MDPIDACLLVISFIFLFVVLTSTYKEFLDVPIAGTVEPGIGPNYFLMPPGTSPSVKQYGDTEASRLNYPYYEGPYGEVILPSNMGAYSHNVDYQDYAGVYP